MIDLVDVYSEPKAIDVLWDLLAERSVDPDSDIINISHRSLPSYEKHKAFVESRPYAYWYLIRKAREWLGVVYITKHNEIGIHLFMNARGGGIGTIALKLLLAKHEPLPAIPAKRAGHFVANINPRNVRSIRLFGSLGFKHVQSTYALGP